MLVFHVAAVSTQAQTSAENEPCAHPQIFLTAVDQRLQPVGLERHLLQATLGNTPIKITSVTRERPSRMIVLLDNSGSMHEKKKLPRSIVDYVLTHSPVPEPIALIAFGKDRQRFGFENSVSKLRTILWDGTLPEPNGRTALFDALSDALQLLGTPNPADVILIVTDTAENASRSDRKQIAAMLAISRARIFAIVIPPRLTYPFTGLITDDERNGAAAFASLLEESGGAALVLQRADNDKKNGLTRIEPPISGFLEAINNPHVAGLELVVPWNKKARLKIGFGETAGKEFRKTELFYQQRIPECTAQATSK